MSTVKKARVEPVWIGVSAVLIIHSDILVPRDKELPVEPSLESSFEAPVRLMLSSRRIAYMDVTRLIVPSHTDRVRIVGVRQSRSRKGTVENSHHAPSRCHSLAISGLLRT